MAFASRPCPFRNLQPPEARSRKLLPTGIPTHDSHYPTTTTTPPPPKSEALTAALLCGLLGGGPAQGVSPKRIRQPTERKSFRL